MATLGYSGTPLAKKLGIKEGSTVWLIAAPEDVLLWLSPLPEAVRFVHEASDDVDIVHLFATQKATLQVHLERLRSSLRADASVWVSWPKQAAKVATDIREDTIRTVALPLGYVDIKVCAVSELWSGLKLVVRKELR